MRYVREGLGTVFLHPGCCRCDCGGHDEGGCLRGAGIDCDLCNDKKLPAYACKAKVPLVFIVGLAGMHSAQKK